MKIGVIGAGWPGDTVAKLWVKAGREVTFSSRYPEKYADVASRVGSATRFRREAPVAMEGALMLRHLHAARRRLGL